MTRSVARSSCCSWRKGYDVRAYRGGDGLAADPEALRAHCLVADLVIRAETGSASSPT